MTIAEVSKKSGLSVDTLRYYERIGIIPEVIRKESGVRDYSEDNLKWVEFSKLMRGAGVSIEALIEYIKLFQKGDSTATARKQILIEQRDQIETKMKEMQKTLDKINTKIANYEKVCLVNEKKLKKNKMTRKKK